MPPKRDPYVNVYYLKGVSFSRHASIPPHLTPLVEQFVFVLYSSGLSLHSVDHRGMARMARMALLSQAFR